MTDQHSLPHPAAKARLLEISAALRPSYEAANSAIEKLCLKTPADFEKQQRTIRGMYWALVMDYLEEIAALTNNSKATLASVMHPAPDTLDLGGITPAVLWRLANNGTWRGL